MSSAEDTLVLPRRPALLTALARFICSPRFAVYLCCSLIVVLTSYELGKDMAWDTLDYHFYAGFSALHHRFGQDYFPAGPQSYLNPYVYVPFYLLATSGLTAPQVALILAAVQSVILWLAYELALAVAPPSTPRRRLALALCAVALAYGEPVLLNELGSSFADITTAELVVGGWLLLVLAIRRPAVLRLACAGLLLGCATALKLTNAIHAVSAGVLVLFVPGGWWRRARDAALFCAAGAVGFAVVAAPWAVGLERHFGNPFFPLLNGIFRSPEFTTARIIDYRFIPISLGAALWRPFAMIAPDAMVHVEWASPDLRYALLLLAMVAASTSWVWRQMRRKAASGADLTHDDAARARVALGLAFLVDWSLWLTASGNSRYFIPMACVAAVLAIALLFRLCAGRPKLLNYLLLAVFGVQFLQLHMGTEYPSRTGWRDEPWFQVSVPRALATEPALYFNIGIESDSFIAPYLAPGSGLINLEGDYTLGPRGAGGRRIESLIRRYSPHLRVLVRDIRRGESHEAGFPYAVKVKLNDALDPFGLQLDTGQCAGIVVRGITSPIMTVYSGSVPPKVSPTDADIGHFISCAVVPQTTRDPAIAAGEGPANVVLDRLEDACPALFQPRRQVSYLLGDEAHGYIWARQYVNTDMSAWVAGGWVHFQRLNDGGKEGYAGTVTAWEKAPPPVTCGRGPDGYFLRVIRPH